MNIVYFLNSVSKSGGIERMVIEKSNYLSKNHKVFILTTSQKNKNYFYHLDSSVHHIDFSDYGVFKGLFAQKRVFKKIIEEIKPDIIIAVTGKESLLLPFFDNTHKKIKEFHFTKNYRLIQHKKSLFYKRLFYYLLTKMEEGVYGSFYNMVTPLTYEDEKNWNISNTKVIYNFKPFKSKQKSDLKTKTVIAVGRLDYQKGFDRLLKAWKIVIDKHSDWQLNICGDGVLKSELLNLAQKLQITDFVTFKGNVENIKKYYLQSSIYVLSSRHEGMPLSILEAMECGVAVVSFDAPCGPKELIEEGINGMLVENGSIEELANKIISLIESRKKREELVYNANTKIKLFSKENIMNKWEELFEKVVNEK